MGRSFYKASRRSKYGNLKREVDGIVFHSKKEANYYLHLKTLKRAGEIIDFEIQPRFELQPKFYSEQEEKTIRAITYVADFLVFHNGYTEIVEVKGYWKETAKLKWKMLLYKYGQTGEYKFTVI